MGFWGFGVLGFWGDRLVGAHPDLPELYVLQGEVYWALGYRAFAESRDAEQPLRFLSLLPGPNRISFD